MKILIIGGNKFFGKQLAQKLVDDGHDLTLLNRGNVDDGLGDKISRIKCDRTDTEKMKELLADSSWDIVYDQVCFDYEQAKAACEIFKGKTAKYIHTSSQSVYDPGKNLKEEIFDPAKHEIEKMETKDTDYGEAKRQAEVAYNKFASFPVTMVRFPIVIGPDDHTNRFKFHVDKIRGGEPFYLPNFEAMMSFIHSDFAADALMKLGQIDFQGPINVASPKPIKLGDLMDRIENFVGKKGNYISQYSPELHSQYGVKYSWYMDCSKLHDLGIQGTEIEEWLPGYMSSSF